MGVQVFRNYEYKVFESGQLKALAVELMLFLTKDITNSNFMVVSKAGDMEYRDNIDIHQLGEVNEIGKKIEGLSFFIGKEWIRLFESNGNLSVMYNLSCGPEEATKIFSITEEILELKAIQKSEPGSQTIQENTESPSTNLTSEQILLAWGKAIKVVKKNLEPASFDTWIAPVVPGAEGNFLVLFCPNVFGVDWLKSRYKSLLLEIVQSIEPAIEDIIFRVAAEEGNDKQRQIILRVDEDLFDLMNKIYEKDTEGTIGWTFEKYFTQMIQSICQDRLLDSTDRLVQL
ncbi:DnaA-like protein [Desulfitobacterium sp. LBE]|uniref:DnaA N-terminal domain-containing protein n=1 Tax=bioreactor metagenome TaxID=1076179 RepID=A0A644TWQ5_9ZZZZ|nr:MULTISPECIES: DnaA N-terminal domain-containing protein [Desulfitobacterium]MEA5022071.1 DnaA N-terminal domain-containing protein [Desulfitobacterium hafniense]TWH59284.1 DnaA-like protein [Desulfitobacterium sp. LBE]